MSYVIKAKYVSDYKIEIVFDDQKTGIVDLESVIKNDHRLIFRELKDQKKFSQIRVDMDTVVWSNGLDLAPEFLRNLLIKQHSK
jgi:hypothetical protein